MAEGYLPQLTVNSDSPRLRDMTDKLYPLRPEHRKLDSESQGKRASGQTGTRQRDRGRNMNRPNPFECKAKIVKGDFSWGRQPITRGFRILSASDLQHRLALTLDRHEIPYES
jgi:hypothetical protein